MNVQIWLSGLNYKYWELSNVSVNIAVTVFRVNMQWFGILAVWCIEQAVGGEFNFVMLNGEEEDNIPYFRWKKAQP